MYLVTTSFHLLSIHPFYPGVADAVHINIDPNAEKLRMYFVTVHERNNEIRLARPDTELAVKLWLI